MKHLILALTAGTVLSAMPAVHDEARAGDLLGIEAGVAIGSGPAPARPAPYASPRYYEPAPVYAGPGPTPVPPPACYWVRGEPVWDGYGWVRPRVQVCE